MRSLRGFRPVLAVLGLAALVAGTLPAGAGGDQGDSVPITFSHGHVVDIQRLAGEPELKSDSAGNLYVTGPIGVQYAHSFLWKSEDGGDSFDLLRAFPPTQRPMPSADSGDATTAIVPGPEGTQDDAIVWSDMVNLAGLANAASFDGGNTFPPDHWNLFASGVGADRQWLDGMRLPGTQTDRVYQVYNQTPLGGLSVIYSDDYGKSWVDGQRGIDGFSTVGNVAANPALEKVHIAYASGGAAMVATAGVDANDFEPRPAGLGSGSVANLFVSVDVDTAGNVYVAYSESGGARATYLAVSDDGGQTFRQFRVSPPEQKATVFPWVVAGDPGRAWVVWYGSEANGSPPSNRGPWHLYGSQTLNGLAAEPSFQVLRLSEHPMHDNEICLSGLGCTVGQAEDRNMLDDFTSDVDPEGMLHVSYNDTNNQLAASGDADAGGAFAVHVRQESGPSVFEAVGAVTPSPAVPEIAAAEVAGGTLSVSGVHSLPAGNWGDDLEGDGRFPRHGPGGPGPSDPGLDLTEAWISEAEGGELTAHLKLKEAPGPLTAGGGTIRYMAFLWHEGQVHFAAADVIAGEVALAWAGTPDFIPNQAGIAKIATYEPAGQSREIMSTSEGGFDGSTLEIRIPASVIGNPAPGTRFDQVTGLVQLPTRGPGLEVLMDPIDATPATSWVMGDPRLPAGEVQLSVDDPDFASPVAATLTDYPGTSFEAALDVSGLAPGEHTLYVRQTAKGFVSEPVAVGFTV